MDKKKLILGGLAVTALAAGAVVASRNEKVRSKAKEIIEHEKVQNGLEKTKEVTKKTVDKSKELTKEAVTKGKETTKKVAEKGKEIVNKNKDKR